MVFSLVVWCVLWEISGRLALISLSPPFTHVVKALFVVIPSADFIEAATITLQAFAIGMGLALIAGISIGVLMGRIPAVGNLMGMWVNIFESSPLTAIVPALMTILGFGLPTM